MALTRIFPLNSIPSNEDLQRVSKLDFETFFNLLHSCQFQPNWETQFWMLKQDRSHKMCSGKAATQK